jgi:hypothetical protein
MSMRGSVRGGFQIQDPSRGRQDSTATVQYRMRKYEAPSIKPERPYASGAFEEIRGRDGALLSCTAAHKFQLCCACCTVRPLS